ncbi:hypothetical protein NDA13_006210 [Ustilago tritici]|nr:hypothetical protein NDA13_006210 [Ustilago tritici]
MTATPFFTAVQGASLPPLEGTTLLVPAVSIGSVPQLAIDLVLHHPDLKLRKVGRLDPSFCFPFVGPFDSADDDDVTTALEVFSNGTLTVMQQRSPVFKSRDSEYIPALTQWISSSNFTEVLWLSSIDAAARTDEEFSTPILHLLPPNASASTPLLSTVSKRFPAFKPPKNSHERVESSKVPNIPGSLLTRKLLRRVGESSEGNQVKLGALLYFAAEGDTRQDAHNLANVVLLNLLTPSSEPELRGWGEKVLKEPASWSALFGQPANSALYA